MLLYKQKKNALPKGNRILINVTVMGTAGPIRLVVNEDEVVSVVIDSALKSYAHEGRLPVLDKDLNNFILYSPVATTVALLPSEKIGSFGIRNFILQKKPPPDGVGDGMASLARREDAGIWKALFYKPRNLDISSR